MVACNRRALLPDLAIVDFLYGYKKGQVAHFFLIAVGFVSRGIFYSLGNASGVVTFTLSTADQLGIGALLAVMEAEGKLENINPNKFLGLLLMILVAGGLLQLSSTGLLSAANEVSKHFFFAFCYFCLIGYILTISQNHWLKRVLKSGFLTYTGKISYGLYVYHPLCFILLERHCSVNSMILSLLLAFAAAYLAATVSYYAFESRFLVFKKYFINKPADMKVTI